MICNIFDSNFRHDAFSTAHQQSQHIEWVRDQMAFDGITVFTDEWINNPIVDEVKSRYKIGWLHEPYCLHPETYIKAFENRDKFGFVLTYYEPFLSNQLPEQKNELVWRNPFRFAPYAGTWINQRDWGIKPKTGLCSMLIGSKLSTEGHRIRHEIADMIDDNGFNVDFYGVKGETVGYGQETKYKVLADYCFSIVTEICREDNLFTEWLLDCFALGTIPIFWGAPNIHEFFDAKGILQFDTIDRLYKILAGISYTKYLATDTYSNLLKLKDYRITEDWIYQNVLRDLE